MSLDKKNSINNILEEKRIFPPSKKFAENSNISTQEELINLKFFTFKYVFYSLLVFWKIYLRD